MKHKTKGFVFIKAKIFIGDQEQEFAGRIECGLEDVQAEAVRALVDYYQRQQSKTSAVLDAAVVSGKSTPTIWRYLTKIFAGGQ